MRELNGWFSPSGLRRWMGKVSGDADRIGREWLLTDGKRLRPMLTATVYTLLKPNEDPKRIAPVAIAVECFHKASLVHDDIEDGDLERYQMPTVHARYGVPSAINAGDWLLGEGYRLLAESPFPVSVRCELLRIAANGHKELALGQGEELAFCRDPHEISSQDVFEIYRRKTGAAFEVAMQCGAAAAGLDKKQREALTEFSLNWGTLFQTHDDMDDLCGDSGRRSDILALRPTLFLAEACRSKDAEVRRWISADWKTDRKVREKLLAAILHSDISVRVTELCREHSGRLRKNLQGIRNRRLREFLEKFMPDWMVEA